MVRASGIDIDYIELVDRPNSEVLAYLASCDFVVDELYSDTALAGLSGEAACLGKPSVLGSLTKREELGVPDALIPPSFVSLPERIVNALYKMAMDKDFREDLGRRARRFVESEWDPSVVAGRFHALLEDGVPNEWFFAPSDIKWFSGWGIATERLRRLLFEYIEAFGTRALFLGEKPELIDMILEFTAIEKK